MKPISIFIFSGTSKGRDDHTPFAQESLKFAHEYIYVGDVIGISSRQSDVIAPFFNVVLL